MARYALLVSSAVLTLLLVGCGSDASVPAAASESDDGAACRYETLPSQGASHEQRQDFQYNSFPPTSGPAWLDAVAFDLYGQPVDQVRLLHNLMHGGVAVQYGSEVPEQATAAIESWYAADRRGVVVAPLPRLGKQIVLSAWTHLAVCSRFDSQAFGAFRDEYRFHGPERLSPAALDPEGTQLRKLLGEIQVTVDPARRTRIVVEAKEPLVVVTVVVTDADGNRIRVLPGSGEHPQGQIELDWDGRDDQGLAVPPGSYVVRVAAASTTGDLTQSEVASIELR